MGWSQATVLPTAGDVVVEAPVVGAMKVVGAVVDAAERQRRPEMIALGRVVVDHVEDDLDAGRVQRLDRLLELAPPGP